MSTRFKRPVCPLGDELCLAHRESCAGSGLTRFRWGYSEFDLTLAIDPLTARMGLPSPSRMG